MQQGDLLRASDAGRRVIVHYGILKTGSSSIQETLYQNRTVLKTVCYPDLGLANGSLTIAHAFAEPRNLVDRHLVANLATAQVNRRLARHRLSQALARSGSAVPVLSAEVISWFSDGEISALDEFLRSAGLVPSYVGYIREPVSYLRSVFQETLKTQMPVKNILMRGRARFFYRRHYTDIVDRLDAVAGQDNVAAFAFDRSGFPGGDVVQHFLGLLGQSVSGLPITRVNEGLSLLAVKLLFTYRRLLDRHDSAIGSPASQPAFIAALGQLPGREFQLSPELVSEITAANAPMFEWSARRLDRPLHPPVAEGEGVRFEEELMSFSQDEVDHFSAFAAGWKVRLPTANPKPEDIAQAMRDIRLAIAATAHPA